MRRLIEGDGATCLRQEAARWRAESARCKAAGDWKGACMYEGFSLDLESFIVDGQKPKPDTEQVPMPFSTEQPPIEPATTP